MRKAPLVALALTVLMACAPGANTPPSAAPSPTAPSATPAPGVSIAGHVRLGDGTGLAGVTICRTLASYPGRQVAVTGPDGAYEAEFFAIPGDEMVAVWASLPGYTFDPEYYRWRHSYGLEERTLDFVARLDPGSTSPLGPCPGP